MILSVFEQRKLNIFKRAINYIHIGRAKGFMGIEEQMKRESFDTIELKFLQKGMEMIIEGKSSKNIEFIMNLEKCKCMKDLAISGEEMELILICESVLKAIQKLSLLEVNEIFSYLFAKESYSLLEGEAKNHDERLENTEISNKVIEGVMALGHVHTLYPDIEKSKFEKMKIEMGLERFAFYKDPNFGLFHFGYLAQSEEEKIFMDIFYAGEQIESHNLIDKIRYMENAISIIEEQVYYVLEIMYKEENLTYEEQDEVLSTESIEEFMEIVERCRENSPLDVNRRATLIINKEGIHLSNNPLAIQ